MSAPRVVVVGAVNTDFVIRTPHLPAPGETVLGGGLQVFGGGKGANAAVAAARAGAAVHLIGAVGDDDAGTSALALLRRDGIDTAGVARLAGVATGAALIIVNDQGENQIALGPGANGALEAAFVRTQLDERLAHTDVVLVSTEIPFAAVAAAVETTTRAGVPCILNPAPVIDGLETLLAHGPVVTPNEGELRDLVRRLGGDAADTGAGESTLARLGGITSATVVVTLGGRGCAARASDGTYIEVPAPPDAEVVDTTGAGDTFNGVFALCLARRDDVRTALRTAVAAASLSVGAAGAREGMPGAAAITAAMQRAGA